MASFKKMHVSYCVLSLNQQKQNMTTDDYLTALMYPCYPCFPGPGYVCRQNNCSSLLVPHLPGPGDQCQHPQPELSLEAGGCRAAAASGGTSRRLGLPRCEDSQEHHLSVSPYRDEQPRADGTIIYYTVQLVLFQYTVCYASI